MKAVELQKLVEKFAVAPKQYTFQRISKGFIHNTYRVDLEGRPFYVLQRINTEIFQEPQKIVQNQRKVLPMLGQSDYRSPEFIPTRSGEEILAGPEGSAWRLMSFTENSKSLELVKDTNEAYNAGCLLGTFHRLTRNVALGELEIMIPRFHDLKYRMKQYGEALSSASEERLLKSLKWRETVRDIKERLDGFAPGSLPDRLCHNDAKLDNILFSESDGRGLCLIDLDTLMPGKYYYDFGDLARTVVSPVTENEADLSKVVFRKPFFESLVKGYLETSGALTENERRSLAYGVVYMPFIHGLRALTDFLQGDLYYQVTHPEQNLIRSGALFRFAEIALKDYPYLLEVLASSAI